MDTQERVEQFRQSEEAALVAERQARAERHNEYLAYQKVRVESERVTKVADLITAYISQRFFLTRELAVIEPEHTYLLTLRGSGDSFMDPGKTERLNFVRQEIARIDAYLQNVTDFSQADIAKNTEAFSAVQNKGAILAARATAAATKNERDNAKPQPSGAPPVAQLYCARCNGMLRSESLALHKNATGWCVRDPRMAYASGRDAFWLVSEGGCSIQELRDANVPIPESLLS
jgi:hypothetical protein